MADVKVTQYKVAAAVNSVGTQNNRLAFCATEHTQAEVATAGYFNNVRHLMTPGDIIHCSCVIGGVNKVSILRAVLVPATGNVTTAVVLAEA